MSSEQRADPTAGGPSTGSGRSFVLNVNLVFLSTVASSAVLFVTAVLLARALGPEGRGVTVLYQSAIALAFAFASFGIAAAVVYFVARRDVTPRQALEGGLSVTFAAALLAALGVLLAALVADDRLDAEGLPYWLGLVALPAVLQHRLVEAVLRARGRFVASSALDLLQPIVALIAFAAIEATAGLTIGRAVAVWSFSFLPAVVLGYALLGPQAWPRRLAAPAALVSTVRFGVQAQSANLVQQLNYRADSYLVLIFVNAAGVGLYSIGVSLSEGMWLVANAVAIVLQTNLTAGDAAYAARTTPLVCRNALLLTGAGALAAAAVAPFVVPLVFGDAFEDAVLPFVLLLPGTVAMAGGKILAAYVFSRGRPLLNAAIALAALLVTLGADLVLIPLLEVKGAAIGASIGYGVSFVLTALVYRALSGGSLRDALLPRLADAALYVEAARSLAGRLPLARRFAGGGVRT